MKFRQFKGLRPYIALGAAAAAMLPAAACAQEEAESWQWRATVYGWLANLQINTEFPSGAGGSINIDADTLLDNLEFTFMGALQAKKGSWGVFTDVVYMNVGGSKSNTREFSLGEVAVPADVTLDARYDMKSWVWTLAGLYGLSDSERHVSDFLFGFRMVDIDQTLDWTVNGDIGSLPLPGRSGSGKVTATNWDAVIGLKGHVFLGAGERWFVPYLTDIGTGDSDLTWQAMAGIGYQFGWGAVVLNWRYLEYELESGSPVSDMNFSGPLLGASFAW